MVSWVTNVLTLPNEMAKAFGFTKTISILDHVDTADVMISGRPEPFTESRDILCLIDIVKFVAMNDNYIMACQDQSRFYATLPSLSDDTNCNLIDYIELVSMIGIVPYADDRQFMVEFAPDRLLYTLTVDACGCIPSYLQLWEELNRLYDEMELKEDDEVKEEERLIFNSHMQHAMQILFGQAGDAFEVMSARRTTRNSGTK